MQPIRIDPSAIYREGDLALTLDVALATLTRARREGRLRYTRQGQRVFILGQWVLDWLASSAWAEQEAEVAHA